MFFGPLAFRSLREFFTGRARYEKRSGAMKGLLLGVCFVAEGPIRRNTFGRLTQSQSCQSKSFGVHFQMHRLKDEMANRPMITCIVIVIICKGHECNFSQAASCAYKNRRRYPYTVHAILHSLMRNAWIFCLLSSRRYKCD